MWFTNVSLKSAHKSVRQRCLTRAPSKSFGQECLIKMPHEKHLRVYDQSALHYKHDKNTTQKCQTTAVFKEVPGTRVSFSRVSHLMSHESVSKRVSQKECLKKSVSKRVSQKECLKKSVSKRVSQRFCDCHCCHSEGGLFAHKNLPVVSSARMPENAWASFCLGMRCLMIVL